MPNLESKLDESPQSCDKHEHEKKKSERDGSAGRYPDKPGYGAATTRRVAVPKTARGDMAYNY